MSPLHSAPRLDAGRAIGPDDAPKKITIDKSGAKSAALESYNAEHESDIESRLGKAGGRRRRGWLKSFRSTAATLSGVRLMRTI
jgi:putative transposase